VLARARITARDGVASIVIATSPLGQVIATRGRSAIDSEVVIGTTSISILISGREALCHPSQLRFARVHAGLSEGPRVDEGRGSMDAAAPSLEQSRARRRPCASTVICKLTGNPSKVGFVLRTLSGGKTWKTQNFRDETTPTSLRHRRSAVTWRGSHPVDIAGASRSRRAIPSVFSVPRNLPALFRSGVESGSYVPGVQDPHRSVASQ